MGNKLPKLPTLAELQADDLGYIAANLNNEFAEMAGCTLLLTGGAGFLGYYLVQSVLFWNTQQKDQDAIKLTVFDNYFRGAPDWLKSLKSNPALTLVQHDMTQRLPSNMPDVQYVIHAAGIASPKYYRQFPIECMDSNITGLRNLLDYAVRQAEGGRPLRGFMFFSSSEVYGDPSPDMIPTREDYRGNVSFTGPRACYDESKRYGETLCVNFARQCDVHVTIARPFNNYGPGLKITDKRVIPDFMRDVFQGRDIVLLSDGKPTRTFCYVADAVCGYFKVLVNGRKGEPYNIGIETPEISVLQLAQKVAEAAAELIGYKGRVKHGVSVEEDYLVDNPNRRCPDITKARQHLGYDPRILIDEGIEKSLIWYSHNQTAEDA